MHTQTHAHRLLLVFFTTIVSTSSIHAAKWKVTDLGPVGAQSWLFLNNSGQVTGTNAPGPNGEGFKTAFVTGPNGTNRRNVYSNSSLESVAIAINDSGMVMTTTGSNEDWTNQISNSNSAPTVFTSLARSRYYYSDGDLNNTGKVIGQGNPLSVGAAGYQPYIANQDGTNYQQLAASGSPLRITDTNIILFSDFFSSTDYGPAISVPNTQGITPIQKPSGATYIHAYGMSNLGQVVGEVRFSDNMPHAFITGANGIGLTEIGTLGQPLSYALDANNKGEVVGSYGDNRTLWHAMITGPNGQNPRDLATEVTLPTGYLTSAMAINEAGQVAAIDYYNKKAYLLTPINDAACSITVKTTPLGASKKLFGSTVTIKNLNDTALHGWQLQWSTAGKTKLFPNTKAKLTQANHLVTVEAKNQTTLIGAGANVIFNFLTVIKHGISPEISNLSGTVSGKVCTVSHQ